LGKIFNLRTHLSLDRTAGESGDEVFLQHEEKHHDRTVKLGRANSVPVTFTRSDVARSGQ
jgi:hypothetical protein